MSFVEAFGRLNYQGLGECCAVATSRPGIGVGSDIVWNEWF